MKLPSVFASRTLPWVLLAISVALNVFFVGGHLYGRGYYHAKGDDRMSALSERLGLDEEQRAAFRESRRSLRPKFRELRAEARPIVNRLWDEMAKPEPNQAAIDAELKALADMRLGFERDALASAQAFMQRLTPEQRKTFADYARDRFPGPPGMGGRRSRSDEPDRDQDRDRDRNPK